MGVCLDTSGETVIFTLSGAAVSGKKVGVLDDNYYRSSIEEWGKAVTDTKNNKAIA